MPLSKKQLIIFSLVSLIIIIIVINIFLFLNYQKKQAEIQAQQKIATDIQKVQLIISQGKVSELNIESLKAQGYAQEAINLADQAIKQYEEEQKKKEAQVTPLTESEKIQTQILSTIDQYNFLDPQSENTVYNSLAALGNAGISKLTELSQDSNNRTRYSADMGFAILANKNQALRTQILPLLKKGLSDKNDINRATVAQIILQYGDKDAFPVLTDYLDPKYRDVTISSEPPIPLDYYALLSLSLSTNQDFGADKSLWLNWWNKNKDRLKWDETQKKFIF